MPLIPYEILIRLNSKGAFQGASLRQWDSDRRIETPPEDLGNTSDPRFQEIVGTALTAANAQVVELQAQLTTAQSDAAEVPSLRDRVTQLESELEGYRSPPQPTENWAGVLDALRGTPVFGKAFGTASTNGWSLLLASLTYSHNLADVSFALQAVRAGLPEDFTPQEIEQINLVLSTNGIPLQL